MEADQPQKFRRIPKKENTMSKHFQLTILVMIALFAISAFAQAQGPGAPIKPAVTKTCYASFNTALPNFCVTENGNIENFVYPSGYSQIYTDGYGVCDITGGNPTTYYDIGITDSGNWGSPIITEPNGANTFPLTIKRTTSDGIWTITQQYSRSTADAYVKVIMTWKNNSAVNRFAWMTRYVDIDADGNGTDDYFDGSTNAGWGYTSVNSNNHPNYGLTIRSNQSVHSYFGIVSARNTIEDPCSFSDGPYPYQGDGAVMYLWSPNGTNVVGAGKTVKFTLEYRPM
jgi:hypothetical protein